MYKSLFISIIMLLSSCGLGKHYCEKHYSPVIKDSIYTKIEYCWDSIPYDVPYKVIVHDTILPELPKDISYHYHKKQNGLTANLDIDHGHVSLLCAEDSLKLLLAVKDSIITNYEHTVVKSDCDRRHHNGWDSFCNYFTGFSLFLATVFIVILGFKK